MAAEGAWGAGGAQPQLLTGWGRTAPTRAVVCSPRRKEHVERLMEDGTARGVVARGLGRSYGDAAQNAGGGVLDMTALARLKSLDHDSGRVTVEAGVSLDELMRAVLPSGWFLPVSPGTRYVTIGGAIACDIHGKNHHRDGSFCQHVSSLELQVPTGERLTVAPDCLPEVFWATAGGMGLTGVILEATLRLLPVETAFMRVDTERTRDLDDTMDRMEREDSRYRYSVAWIDLMAKGARCGRSVLMRGDHATAADLPAGSHQPSLAPPPKRRLAAPVWAPSGLVRRAPVSLFNELWYRNAGRVEGNTLQPLHSFFHPLDGIRDWNRVYGRRGFVQYQLVVPFGEEATVHEVVGRLSSARCPSFLGVFKRFGHGQGPMSFPMPGWTLAVDIPAAVPGLSRLLDGLDQLVAAARGRVYLAKDSRLRPELLDSMYPGLEGWRDVRARLDPERMMQSDLARRLPLHSGAA